jgi:phenylpropionate dioxygenase-like ring-hydroxylating dioxygenase large terminal subunit
MIPNQWYVVLDSNQVKKKPVGVTRMGEKLVFWRDKEGRLSCLRDQCVHRGVQLSKGRLVSNGHLQCPFHGFEYDTTGRATKIPANGQNASVPERFKVHSYPTHEAHGFVWIWWGKNPPTPHLDPPPFFDDIDDGYTYGQVLDPWEAHYSRVIENQLDVVHLPFVHHNTIGRGCRTLVDGPGIEWVNDHQLNLYVYNRVDDGSTPLTPQQVPVPDATKEFKIEFIFPNLWENHFGDQMNLVVAFVPIDGEHTILYLRMYQKTITVPVLRELYNWIVTPFNLIITRQDRRVVITQQPKASALRSGEKLIQGDYPILEYRKRRQALIDAAASPQENAP